MALPGHGGRALTLFQLNLGAPLMASLGIRVGESASDFCCRRCLLLARTFNPNRCSKIPARTLHTANLMPQNDVPAITVLWHVCISVMMTTDFSCAEAGIRQELEVAAALARS